MATEERRLMDLARTVPAILLLIGTSGRAIASIKCARELFAGKKCGFNDSDDPETPPPNTDQGGNGSVGGDHSGSGVPSKTTCGSQAQASLLCGVSVDSGGWAGVLASALAPGEGHLPVAYREITRLLSLHAEAGHVFLNCAPRLGLQPDDDEDNGGGGGARIGLQTHRAAPWKWWMKLREAAVCHAHDVLLALSSAAAAATAGGRGPPPVAVRRVPAPGRMAVGGAAGSSSKTPGAASARQMRDAVLCEFFVTWMILTNA